MSRSETMPRPVHSYESHHPDDIARRERDNSAFGNKVSRLKNVFQTENKGSSNHISYNRQNSKSPDIKRKRLPSDHAASDVISSTQKIPDPNVDPNIADPQKFFESTSHVQRFQYTRAIFAKMEEQNKREQERRRHFNVPSRERAISPTSPTSRSPVSINRQRLPDSKPPVDYSSKPLINNLVATKPRSSSDPSKMEQEADRKARLHGDGAEQLSPSKRADSVDTLNTGESVGEKVTDKVPSARLIRQRYEEELKQKGGLSGSAPNLSSSYTRGRHNKPDTLPLDNDTTATQGPRSPPRPTGSPERPGIRTTYRTSPERLNSSSYQRTQVRTSLTSDDPTRGRPEPPQEKTDVAKRLSNEFDEAAAEQAGWEGEPAPQHRRFITRGDDNTPRKEHSYHRRVSSNEDKPVPASVAHQDIITDVLGSAPPSGPPPAPPPDTKPEEVVVTRRNHRSNSSPPGGSASNNGGVLLPKRRSREDSSLSREEITASLHEADSYWKRMYGETVPETLDSSKMSDSTYSSGSGEEMARSESGHDLSEVKLEGSPTSPLSPMAAAGDMAVPRRPASWIARYQQQRNSRTSDPLEEKVTLGELNTRRTSQTSNSDAGSNRTSADMEERMNDKSGEVSSPVSRSSSESSSLPSVVKRLSTIEDPDIMNAPPSYPSPPPPVHPSPPPPSQSPSLYVTSPTGGEPDTGAEIRLGGFGGETDTDGLMEEEEESEYGLDERDTIAPLDPPSNAYLHANLGLKKTASPNESIDSMTPSEQDNLLSKTDEDVLVLDEKDVDGILIEREDGDGHEHPEYVAPDNAVTPSVHMLDGERYYIEVAGLPHSDHDDHLYPNAKKPSRITFSVDPIKVFSTYSVEEYDRKNEDVDPMAASAEYELEKRVERMDVFPVELDKGPDGLGLSIIGMGVGADAGLEKLGIFIKTLTEGGAAQRDNRIKVNDQIIEVDGKSLVGVTQAYAASVLRNTSGRVRFLIGREKDPQKSEVARLIQQSIEQDKQRAELARRKLEEQQRQQEEELERVQEQMAAQEERLRNHANSMHGAPPLPEEPPPPVPAEIIDLPSPLEEEEDMTSPTIEVFDLPDDSSSDGVTPEMDPQVLFIKLKEAQYKNAVSEAELAKVKAKMILLENAEVQRRQYEKRCEDMAQRLRESERHLQSAQKDISNFQEVMEKTAGHSQQAAQQLADDYNQLEKKYQKAKKLIKEYQQREKELLSVQEAQQHHIGEKDQQYNALVKSLKDRIFKLERELTEAQKVAGLPANLPQDNTPTDLDLRTVVPPRRPEVRQLSTDLSEISDEEDVSSPDISPVEDSREKPVVERRVAPSLNQAPPPRPVSINGHHSSTKRPAPTPTKVNGAGSPEDRPASQVLNDVPETPLLDTSANKNKAQLAKAGSLANRNPPSKASSHASSQEDDDEDDPFLRHDRDAQSDTSSISQSSYDPSRPMFSGMSSEIPDSLPTAADDSSGGITLISSKTRPEAESNTTLSSFGSSAFGSSSAMVAEYDLDSRNQTYDFSSGTLSAQDEETAGPGRTRGGHGNQYQSSPVPDWSVQQVCHWLLACNMDQYAPEFTAAGIDGNALLTLDSAKLKSLGVNSNGDRATLKKRIKDLKAAIEKERKQHEKEQRARDKLEKQSTSAKKKKFPFSK